MRNLQGTLIISLTIILVLGAGSLLLGFNWQKEQATTVNVKIDKTVIVEKVQDLSRLETVQLTLQRDITIELKVSGLSLFGNEILTDKAVSDYAVTGVISAGVDLSKLTADNVRLENNSEKLVLDIPSAEILSIQINEDKTKLTSEDFTLLFNIRNLDQNRRREMRDELQRQALKQAREALRDGACADNILAKAKENAEKSVKNLFLFSDIEETVVNIPDAQTCEFNLV